MARKTKTVSINGRKYVFGQLPARDGLLILIRLTKLLGEPLGLMASGAKGSSADLIDADLSGDVIAQAVRAMVNRINENEIVDMIEQLLGQVLINDRAATLDDFAGNYGELFTAIRHSLEVQYGNFLGAITAMRGQLGGTMAKAQSGPAASEEPISMMSGSSGDVF